jgi:hypothetical protein
MTNLRLHVGTLAGLSRTAGYKTPDKDLAQCVREDRVVQVNLPGDTK